MHTCRASRTRLTAPVPLPRWTEHVPAPSDSELARRRRAGELTRPAHAPRQVQLVYTDGLADLVEVHPHPGLPAAAPPPPWGLGEDRPGVLVHRAALGGLGTRESWLTAVRSVLRRYDPDGDPQVAIPEHGAAGPAVAGLFFHDAPQCEELLPCQQVPYPLTVSVFRDATGIHLHVAHRREQISEAMAAQFLRHLRRARTEPEADLLDPGELARVVALGRPPGELPEVTGTVHGALARLAAEQPEAVAITDGANQVGYGELLDRATRLAGGLRDRGVQPGDRVGVCLERDAELVVTLLGVLAAGATYVPMDPAYPAQRLAHTVRDAALAVVLTRRPDFPGPAVAPDEVSGEPFLSTSDGAAYVIYTSGSTGRPKGVVVPHRNVLALVAATRPEYALSTADVWTWFHSSAFDFSVWEIWGCLLTGGRLVVVPYFVSREPDRFAELLAAEGVTVLSQTPSAFTQLLTVDHHALSPRLVVFGGEPLDARVLLPWFDQHPGSRVVNMFGITETTVHVTHQTLDRSLALAATRSVGPALPGWHLLVLDPEGRVQPPGVPGEICVGGAGVATGYLGQETLTAQRFRWNEHTGSRLYHSGDLGRLRPDGRLEHLGRIDSQVKLRGFRIELEEIRTVLLEDPSVRAAAVVVHQDDPADPATARLAAYVVPATADPAALRTRAAGLLPEYMLPTTITPLDTLPLTTNGKLDVAALPSPDTAPAPAAEPRTLSEHLAHIWQEVLGHPVGPDDDFFELGGNSLLAVRLGAAMRAQGLPQLRLRDLYRHPTIREVNDLLSA